MFGSDIMDVVLALAFTFFLLSIVASAGQELIAQAMQWRARTLRRGVGQLLGDPAFDGLAAKVYDHPLIASLNNPSYLRGGRFADSLLAVVDTADAVTGATIHTVAEGVNALPDGAAKAQLQILVRQSGQDLAKLRDGVAAWYDEGMERLSGVYKRNSQKVLLVLGLAMAVLFNVDAIAMAQTLATNPSIRNAIVESAGAVTTDGGTQTSPEEAIKLLNGVEPGIGWSVCWYASAADPARSATALPAPCGANLGGVWPPADAWASHILWRIPGWIFTALAVMLGAPFWFDVLNRVVQLRATGKKVG